MASLAERLTACKVEIERLRASIQEAKMVKCNGGFGAASASSGVAISPITNPSPKRRRTLTGHHGKVYSASWSSSGDELVSTGQDSKLIHWDVRGNHKLASVPLKTVWAMACCFVNEKGRAGRDARSLVACGGLDNACSVYDLETGERLLELQGHEGYVSSICCSSENRIATASGDGTVRLWDAQGGRMLHVFADHGSDVLSVAFNPGEPNMLVSGSVDATAKLWDSRLRKACVRTYSGSGGQTGIVREHGNKGIEGDVNSVRFFPSGTAIGAAGDDAILRLFDLRANAVVSAMWSDSIVTSATSFDFSSSGRLAFVGHEDSNVYAWDCLSEGEESKRPVWCLSGHGNHISSVGVSSEGSAVFSASWDSEIGVSITIVSAF
jgi:guanine nucleotide-binding protein G(I)/G(S)/G(T) subunit beta-1